MDDSAENRPHMIFNPLQVQQTCVVVWIKPL